MKKTLLLVVPFCLIANSSFASNHHHQRADAFAPIGVMRDHTHEKGNFMASYRYEIMSMDGLRNGDNEVDKSVALRNYMMTPRNMKMKMNMFGLMYGLSDELTLGAMFSYVSKEMENEARNGNISKMETADFGDTKINALYKFYSDDKKTAQFNFGISLPTGENSEYQANGRARMAYAMQNGSGSYEFLPGLSFTALEDKFSYGGQINGTFRLNDNKNGYRFGDVYNATAWVAKPISNDFSVSSRLDYSFFEAIEGSDKNFAGSSMMSPIFRANLGEGEKLFGFIGANFALNHGFFDGSSLALEAGLPIYQRIDGPFLQDKYKLTVGIRQVF